MAALLTSTEDPQEHLTQEQFAAIEAALLQQAEENYRIPTVHFLADLVREAMEKEAQAATTGKGKGSKKAKVTVKEPVHKGKGKKPAIRDDSDSEIGTDIGAHSSTSVDEALLKSLTSTFECRDCIWLTPGAKYMTCNELLAHWQSSHVVQPWESEFVRVSPSEDMPRLLSALRLPPEATLPDIEQVLSASSAMPECSQCNRRMSPRSRCLGTMVSYLVYIRSSLYISENPVFPHQLCHIKNAHRTPLGDPCVPKCSAVVPIRLMTELCWTGMTNRGCSSIWAMVALIRSHLGLNIELPERGVGFVGRWLLSVEVSCSLVV